MLNFRCLAKPLVVGALLLAPSMASALSFSILDRNALVSGKSGSDFTMPTANSTTGTVNQNVTGSPSGRLSPFSFAGDTDFINSAQYSSIQKPPSGVARSSATYEFGTTQYIMKFLWGSPDEAPATRNLVELFLGEDMVASFSAESVRASLSLANLNTSYLMISGVAFDSVVFSNNDSNAFEYGALTTAIPVPASFVLLFAGAAGLAGLRRYKMKSLDRV